DGGVVRLWNVVCGSPAHMQWLEKLLDECLEQVKIAIPGYDPNEFGRKSNWYEFEFDNHPLLRITGRPLFELSSEDIL
ncbi:MAG: hypothetical protein LBJ89_04255, partial [Holosporales bacterium]|nr:hypothetical protein [Holosporales bacterium]